MTRRDIKWLDFEAFHRKHATEHFLVTGASGSGKTTVINHLMASVLQQGAHARALVYDPKQEIIPLLDMLRGVQRDDEQPLSGEVRILNPFDLRCSAWNMALDIDNAVSARQLATILVPDSESETGSASFFTHATRDILTGVLIAFIECVPRKGVWTLRDVLLTMLHEPYLRFILALKRTPGDRPLPLLWRIQETYFGSGADPRTVGNIKASISAKLSVYEPIAAAWHRAAPSPDSPAFFSLGDWIRSQEDILVLGNDEAARAALDPLNRAIFKRATELTLSRPEQPSDQKASGEGQTWYFLDEVREAGELDGLSRLLTKGRSKGACVVLGFQDIDGLRAVYGEEVANELCAQCNNVAVLRLNSPATAQWASELFGRRLAAAQSRDRSIQTGGEGGISLSRGVAEDERPYLYTEAFLYQKTPKELGEVAGFVRGPDTDLRGKDPAALHEALTFRVRWELKVPQMDGWRSAYCPRPAEHYLLEPWDRSDWERLGLNTIRRDPISWKELPDLSGGGATEGVRLPRSNSERQRPRYSSDRVQPIDPEGD